MINLYSGSQPIAEVIDNELKVLIIQYMEQSISILGEIQEEIAKSLEYGLAIFFKGPSKETSTNVDLDVQGKLLSAFNHVFMGNKKIDLKVIVEEPVTIDGVKRILNFSSIEQGSVIQGINPISGTNEMTRGGEYCITQIIGWSDKDVIIPLVGIIFKPRSCEITIATPYEVVEGRVTRNYTLATKTRYSKKNNKITIDVDISQLMQGGISFEDYLTSRGILEVQSFFAKSDDDFLVNSKICVGDFRWAKKDPCHFSRGIKDKIYIGAESISSNLAIICDYVPQIIRITQEAYQDCDIKYRSIGCMSLTVLRAILGDNDITYAQLRPFDYYILKSFYLLVTNYLDGKSETDKDNVPKVDNQSRMIWVDLGDTFDYSTSEFSYKVIIYRRCYEPMIKGKFAFLGPSDFFDPPPIEKKTL